jgi:16S rRNA U1498 N3-methylase RsmE
MESDYKMTIIHCRQCGRNAEPKISTIASAKPIKKCGHCNSINYREATKDERLNVTPLPKQEPTLRLFSV